MHAQGPRVQMCKLHPYRHNSQHTLCCAFSTGRQGTALTGLCQGHALSGGTSDAGRLAPIPAVSPETQAAVLLPLLSRVTTPCCCRLLGDVLMRVYKFAPILLQYVRCWQGAAVISG